MKVGISLKLQEAWKKKFEARPLPPTASMSNGVYNKSSLGECEDVLDDESSDQGQPFNHLSKPNAGPAAVVPFFNSSLGYRDECITVDARQNKKGEYVLMKAADAFDPKQDPRKTRRADSLLDPYCLVITRRFSGEGRLQDTLVEIQSSELINAIRDIVSYYPDNSFRVGETIKCEDPPKLIYYHRKDLAEFRDRSETDDRTRIRLALLLNFLQSHIGQAIQQYEAFLEAGLIKFSHIWMMFKPGCLVYETENEQLYYLESGDYLQTECGLVYALKCRYVNYNGDKIGKARRKLLVRGFANPREINTLSALPFDLCQDRKNLKATLLSRGKRFLELRGIHAMQHANKGRVMVDTKTFLRRVLPGDEDRPNSYKEGIVIEEDCKCRCAVCRKEVDEKPEDYDHEVRKISDDELLLCSSTVLGFALTSHKWLQMKINDLSNIEWSADAIDRLVLDAKQKRALSSLIRSPIFTEGIEGDVIGWKGKGLVLLLHGAPGTGKTLTAESVCENLRRPLYVVSGGELGVTPKEVEKSLKEILELSKQWKAVILIDEADVFLEERSAHDIVRNNFVSELEPSMRKEIWVNALKRLPYASTDIDPQADLDEISKTPLNGRVISYAVRTAKAIADGDGLKLSIAHLWDVVSVQQRFNDHLCKKKVAPSEISEGGRE